MIDLTGAQKRKLEAILYLAGKTEFHILVLEQLAKDLGCADRMTFDIVSPTGRRSAKWQDAYYGRFEIDGATYSVRDFQYVSDVHCENPGGFA